MIPNNPETKKRVGIRDIIWFVMACVFRGIWALLRRVFRGPSRPSWSWTFEFIVGVQRGTYATLARLGVERYNRVLEAILPATAGNTNIETSDAANLPGHWFIPDRDSGTVILYFHGGGYVYGSIRTHGEMIGALAGACSARTFALDYRLAPQHPQPAAIEDACAAFYELVKSGISPDRIILAGDSAGGGLVLATLLALRDAGECLPAGGVAISPWVDLECSGTSFDTNARYDAVSREACLTAARAYLAGSDPRAPYVSPLFGDLRGLPPLLIHAGEVEVLVDQVRDFAERAQSAGVNVRLEVYADMVHVWHMLLAFTPQAKEGLDDIARFIAATPSSRSKQGQPHGACPG